MVLLGAVIVVTFALQACAIGGSDAPSKPETLLEMEAFLLRTLTSVVDANAQKLATLKSLLQDMSHGQSQEGTGFRLVARLKSDWQRVETEMSTEPAVDALDALARRRDALALPTDADLTAAASSLVLLQDTYRLETASLARGVLNGVQYAAELSADDCFDLGKRIFEAEDYQVAETWMEESLARHDGNTSQSKPDIMGYIAYCRYRLGDFVGAVQLSQQALVLDAGHAMSLQDVVVYQAAAESGYSKTFAEKEPSAWEVYLESYKALCRGDFQLDEATRSTLRCRYAHHGSWFLRLARLKEEEAFLSPRILVYHDVISDAEIDAIIAKAKPKLKKARVFGDNSGPALLDPNRSAHSAWLYDNELLESDAVSRRAAHMLGLSLVNAEALQVGSYGVGGQYEPHVDYARDHELNREALEYIISGNRIGTVLLYMNDVEQGGATVFPEHNVSLFPKKGAAAVWFNLHADGVGDPRTRHAGCPVLVGNKWVSNKWFHERGQEFTRPCGLVADSKLVT